MSLASVKVPIEIEGRRLTLSNLQKVLYPETGFAKGQVLDYCASQVEVAFVRLAKLVEKGKISQERADAQLEHTLGLITGTAFTDDRIGAGDRIERRARGKRTKELTPVQHRATL